MNSVYQKFKELLHDYTQYYFNEYEEELRLYKKLNSSKEVIKKFWDPNNRHPHFKYTEDEDITKIGSTLIEQDFSSCTNFEDIRRLIINVKINENTRGLGELAIYDSSLRIGIFMGFKPERIYLHGKKAGSGSYEGAIGLKDVLNKDNKILPIRADRINQQLIFNFISEEYINTYFTGFAAYHIENFLCIYRKELEALKEL